MKYFKSQFNLAIITLFVLCLISGCGNSESAPQKNIQLPEENGPKTEITLTRKQVNNIGVQTVALTLQNIVTPIELPGKVIPKPDQEAYVTSLISGRIERVVVNEGDQVKKGQILVTVVGSELGTLIASLQNSRLELNRQQRLMDRGVGIEKQLQDARISYASSQQQLRAIGFNEDDVEKIATGKKILDYMPLRSPIDGVVLERTAINGGPVSAGDKLFYIVNLKTVWVQAEAYEHDFEKIKLGQSVEINVASYSGKSYTGIVQKIIPKINTGNRTASVIIELANKQEDLKPGMFTTVLVHTDSRQLPAVPASAIQIEGDSTFVVVVENDTTFKRINILAPLDGANYVAILALDTDTKVVTKGAFQIISAMKGIQADDD